MKIFKQSGEYLRPATLDDATFMFECLSDWPNGRWSYSMVEGYIKTSYSNSYGHSYGPRDSIFKQVFVLCTAAHECVGIGSFSFYTRENQEHDGLDIHYLAVHPQKRGQGYYTIFEGILGWFINQYLQLPTTSFSVVDTAPAIAHVAQRNQAETLGTEELEGLRPKTLHKHNFEDYQNSSFDTEEKKAQYYIEL